MNKPTKSRKEKLKKAIFALNGCLFLLSGITACLDWKIVFGIIQIIAGLINLSFLLKRLTATQKNGLQILVYLMNIIVAITVALDYYNEGTEYIQYVWILTALISVIPLVIFLRKNPDDITPSSDSQ